MTKKGRNSTRTGIRKAAKEKKTVLGEKFVVVGIGASAGGLEALEKFFGGVSQKTGIAYVVVTHLSPNSSSLLPELIQKKTFLPVCHAGDNMKVVPDHVYVIPPNKNLAILNTTLQLLDPTEPTGRNLPVDVFLRSLAQDLGSRAAGIILSGSGTDGSLGLRSIKGEGGLVIVQDLESSKYDGMPRSAINTNLADFILAPESMPGKLEEFFKFQNDNSPLSEEGGTDDTQSALQKVFILLRAATNHDFSQYKKNTICRRIERRMNVHQIDAIDDYVRYLQESERECNVLFRELLIGVTSFFRDPEAFQLLKKQYLPELLENKPDNYQIRAWVAGCSTGEEVYSLAIVLHECMETMGRHFSVQIFGTDLDDHSIQKARSGTYPLSISTDVSQERLNKYFNKDEEHFQVKKAIREMVVFAQQNIVKDPPFINLDILCCRNLLIYFSQELQKKILPLFHYSLRSKGILFLGSSESVGSFTDLFTIQDKKWKLFQRKPGDAVAPALGFSTTGPGFTMTENEPKESLSPVQDLNSGKLLQAVLSQSNLPPCVVADAQANIIYIHGRTGSFLEPAQGASSINIVDMARSGLKEVLGSALRKIAGDRKEIVINNVRIQENGGYVEINLRLKTLPEFQTMHRGLVLVIFETIDKGKKVAKQSAPPRKKRDSEVKLLEEELRYTKENLQITIEEMEASNEELKSTNEELQSTNEELQSTNEELETSKEELQSLNEESATVNSELQGRIDELTAANDDIKNLLDATDIATLFLDIDLNIRRFSAKTKELFPLTKTDVGRSIAHFTSNLKEVDLLPYFNKTLADLEKQEVEVTDKEGRIFRVRIRPYRTINNVIDGLVTTFEDITELKQLDEVQRLATVVRDSNDAITVQDFSGTILAWNKGAEKIYGYTETEALGTNIKIVMPDTSREDFEVLYTRFKKEEITPYITGRIDKHGNRFNVWLTVTKLYDEDGNATCIATTERDMRLLSS